MLRAMAPGAVLMLVAILSETVGLRLGAVVTVASALPAMAIPSMTVASTRLRVDGAQTIILSTMGRIRSRTPVGRGARIVKGTKGWHVADADGNLQLDLGLHWDGEQMSRLARYLGLHYETLSSPSSTALSRPHGMESSTTLSRPHGMEQLRLDMSPRVARRRSWPWAAMILGPSILAYSTDRSLAWLFFSLPLAAAIVAWPFYQQPRTYLLADASSVGSIGRSFP